MHRLAICLFALSACKSTPDPLAEQRKTCAQLAADKQLKPGLTLDACAAQLKAQADATDPVRRAGELVDRVQGLVGQGRDKRDAAGQLELRDVLSGLAELGRPAVAPALSRMKASADPELRIALAKALVAICAPDCAAAKFDCIVPALLEGTTGDKPAEVRREAEKGLTHCTGEQLGDDPAAWSRWWAGREAQAVASADK